MDFCFEVSGGFEGEGGFEGYQKRFFLFCFLSSSFLYPFVLRVDFSISCGFWRVVPYKGLMRITIRTDPGLSQNRDPPEEWGGSGVVSL